MTCWLLMPMLRALWNSASILVETSSLAAALADQSACVTINTIAPRRDELLIRVVLGRGAWLQARHRSRLASCKRGGPRWQWSDPVGWKCELRPAGDPGARRPQIPSFRCHGKPIRPLYFDAAYEMLASRWIGLRSVHARLGERSPQEPPLRRLLPINALGCADPPELPEELEGLAAGDILDRSEVLYE